MNPIFIVLIGVGILMSIITIAVLLAGKKPPRKSEIEIAMEEAIINADYANDLITEKQRRYLIHLGAKKKDIPKTKYEASLMIDEFLARGKR
jgi:hypothetical protein